MSESAAGVVNRYLTLRNWFISDGVGYISGAGQSDCDSVAAGDGIQ